MRLVKVAWSAEPVNIPGVALSKYEWEIGFQVYCADWLRKQLSITNNRGFDYWHHSANERIGAMAGFLAKMMGQAKGYPDFVQHALKLAIELKVGTGQPTYEQLRWLEHFRGLGYHSEVIRSFERFKAIVLGRITGL